MVRTTLSRYLSAWSQYPGRNINPTTVDGEKLVRVNAVSEPPVGESAEATVEEDTESVEGSGLEMGDEPVNQVFFSSTTAPSFMVHGKNSDRR